MAYWLVGEVPSKEPGATQATALTPDETGLPSPPNRLLSMTGWTIGEFLDVFRVRTTVWKQPWPQWMDEGRRRAAQIAEEAIGAEGIVVVGHNAAAAFCLDGQDLFEWLGRYAVIPSPAPTRLARYWRVPGMRERAQGFFAGILERHRQSRARGSRASKR